MIAPVAGPPMNEHVGQDRHDVIHGKSYKIIHQDYYQIWSEC